MTFIYTLIVILIIISACIGIGFFINHMYNLISESFNNREYIKCKDKNNKNYCRTVSVINHENKEEAADLILEQEKILYDFFIKLNIKCKSFKQKNNGDNFISNKNIYNRRRINNLKNYCKLFNNKYKRNMQEHFPKKGSKKTSFTINKGSVFSICLRNINDKKLLNSKTEKNHLMFVILHEIAHLCTTEYGHIDSFWKTFRDLLDEAVENKIIEKVDYSKDKFIYCGMEISYNPLFDITLNDDFYYK